MKRKEKVVEQNSYLEPRDDPKNKDLWPRTTMFTCCHGVEAKSSNELGKYTMFWSWVCPGCDLKKVNVYPVRFDKNGIRQ